MALKYWKPRSVSNVLTQKQFGDASTTDRLSKSCLVPIRLRTRFYSYWCGRIWGRWAFQTRKDLAIGVPARTPFPVTSHLASRRPRVHLWFCSRVVPRSSWKTVVMLRSTATLINDEVTLSPARRVSLYNLYFTTRWAYLPTRLRSTNNVPTWRRYDRRHFVFPKSKGALEIMYWRCR